MRMALLLSSVLLMGCETFQTKRQVTCETEVKGQDVDVRTQCDYTSGRDRRAVRTPISG